MFRRLFAAAVLLTCCTWTAPAAAQINGWVTPHVGAASGGDTTTSGLTYGLSFAAFEVDGWIGAEADISHVVDFNDTQLDESSLTSVMVNAIAAPQRTRFQPYLLAGAGVVTVRSCALGCSVRFDRTDVGIDAGAGLQFRFNDYVGVRGDFRYIRVLSDDDGWPTTGSGPFDYYRFGVGVTFTWTQF